ncbi:MAG: nitrilase-related carbon-nitrogen hydrolase, partial [Nakamurella sp.]
MSFHSLYSHGFARVAACTADVFVADPERNAASIVDVSRTCSEQGVAVALFPELSLTGYAIDDLLGQDALLDAVHEALDGIIEASADLLPVIIVGAPLRHQARLFNTAVVIHRGQVLGVVPKLHLPTYREFYERRQFASGDGIAGLEITVAGRTAPFG